MSIASPRASGCRPDEIRELAAHAGHPAARHARRRPAAAAARHAARRSCASPSAPFDSVDRRRGASGGARGQAHRLPGAARATRSVRSRRKRRGRPDGVGVHVGRRRTLACGRAVAERARSSCASAGLDAIAELPLDDQVDDPRRRIDALAAGGFTQVRLSIDKAPAAQRAESAAACRRAAGALRLHPGAQPAAADARRVPADDRLRRREDGGDRAAGGAEHPDDPGGLAALRPEARAGGADVRRRRHRWRVGVGRGARRPAARAARGDSPQHRGGRIRAGRARRPRSRVLA